MNSVSSFAERVTNQKTFLALEVVALMYGLWPEQVDPRHPGLSLIREDYERGLRYPEDVTRIQSIESVRFQAEGEAMYARWRDPYVGPDTRPRFDGDPSNIIDASAWPGPMAVLERQHFSRDEVARWLDANGYTSTHHFGDVKAASDSVKGSRDDLGNDRAKAIGDQAPAEVREAVPRLAQISSLEPESQPVAELSSGPTPLTTKQIAQAFDGIASRDAERWRRLLGDATRKARWVLPARVEAGAKSGGVPARWNPLELAKIIVRKKMAIASVLDRAFRHCDELADWREDWRREQNEARVRARDYGFD